MSIFSFTMYNTQTLTPGGRFQHCDHLFPFLDTNMLILLGGLMVLPKLSQHSLCPPTANWHPA